MFQDLPRLDDIPLENQRVLVRVDLDSPANAAADPALDDHRLRSLLPTFERIVNAGARLVVAGHRPPARPGAAAPSLEPIAERLAELTGWEVHLPDESAGDAARKVVGDLRAGQIACLENLLSDPRETKGDETFARELWRLADAYVLDSLALADRAWSSVTLLPRLTSHRAIGLTLETELTHLARLATQPPRPCIAIVGGPSLHAALPLLTALRGRVDAFCFAGGLAHTLLAATGLDLGHTPIESAALAEGRTLLAQLKGAGKEALLPSDLVVVDDLRKPEGEAVGVRAVPAGGLAVDLGPATLERFRARCAGAGTALWIGAVGHETSPAASTAGRLLATHLAVSGAFTAVVGPAAAAAARSAGDSVASRLALVTDAESAVVAALRGQRLPALEALP